MNIDVKNLVLNHKKVIAVYGLGNVGGVIAAAWLRAGAKVIGVDINKKLLSEILAGTSHKKEPFLSETFTESLKNGSFVITTDGIKASKESDIKIVAVPVGLKKNKADLSALVVVTKNIAKGLKKGDAVVISPSISPGTTNDIVLPLLEKNHDLKGEKDFFLIYSPERIFEGRALKDIEENYPAIVAGLGKRSLDFGTNLLQIISKKGVLKMSNLMEAEAEKLFEGAYRDVNIALANELADFCERCNVNYWEVRKAANSQPYCHLHYPGTGVGGLCIPVYPKIIIEKSRRIGKSMPILQHSRRINDSMPNKCVKDATSLLEKSKKFSNNCKIAVLGLGFRGDVTDSRLSPTYSVVEQFLRKGFSVMVHDPFILEDENLPESVTLSNDLEFVTKNSDLVFISTDHKAYSKLTENSFKNCKKPTLIFDGRNILNKSNFKKTKILILGER